MSGEASLLAVLVCIAAASVMAAPVSQADVLLRFKAATRDDAGALSDWTSVSNAGPCLGGKEGNWTGVRCEDGKVIKLVLESMTLSGTLDTAALDGLPELRSLSLMNNSFKGSVPSLRNLPRLRSVYLAYNRLSGEIAADAFSGMDSLWAVHLEHNAITGPIPSSLAGLPNLAELSLQENEFTGALPEFRPGGGLKLNVSHNLLEGPIPASLTSIDASCFAGNKGLCGDALGVPCRANSDTSTKTSSTPLLVGIGVMVVVVVLAIAAAIFAALRRRRPSEEYQLGRPPSSARKKSASLDPNCLEQGCAGSSGKRKKAGGVSGGGGGGREEEHGTQLVMVQEGRERFELQDLLRASAEVLGGGAFGSSYKAMLLEGPTMVVKRFREMNGVGKEEFQEHMRRLGRLSHPNLLPVVAYYYTNREKLLVTDYIPNGSLSHLLHGNYRSSDRPALDWATRLQILKAVAKGLLYLYRELPMLTAPHGHLKSSNVLLGDAMVPLLADYGLSPVVNPAHASDALVAYRSPEFLQHGRTTRKSDVWSFGILILEVLTGRDPERHVQRRRRRGESNGGSGSGSCSSNGAAELAAWVESLVREERAEELFDGAMEGTKNTRGDDDALPDRPGMLRARRGGAVDVAEALRRIEELIEGRGFPPP
ncbi:unnamed protein product [Spirodela intermedia]|uniref:Protein kinase domain-containing protein n=1 Tax=Spirodela intermedia TaxID=51605 RepID=A0A7I8JM24_SPIIN|nr:unnamed protein product [Spirodela intermedia]CAA6671194.1 unnamed protein product [Spirodela intermedia]